MSKRTRRYLPLLSLVIRLLSLPVWWSVPPLVPAPEHSHGGASPS